MPVSDAASLARSCCVKGFTPRLPDGKVRRIKRAPANTIAKRSAEDAETRRAKDLKIARLKRRLTKAEALFHVQKLTEVFVSSETTLEQSP